MTNVTVFSGTGYAGANITAQTAARGNHVTVVSRTAPAQPLEGVATSRARSARTPRRRSRVRTWSSRPVPAATTPDASVPPTGRLAADAAAQGVRLIVIGGFGSLRPARTPRATPAATSPPSSPPRRGDGRLP